MIRHVGRWRAATCRIFHETFLRGSLMIAKDFPSVEDFPLIRGKNSVIMVRLAAGFGIGGVTQGSDPLRMAEALRDPTCRALTPRHAGYFMNRASVVGVRSPCPPRAVLIPGAAAVNDGRSLSPARLHVRGACPSPASLVVRPSRTRSTPKTGACFAPAAEHAGIGEASAALYRQGSPAP